MAKQQMWGVLVTYGTSGLRWWAKVPAKESAEKLLPFAVAKGFRDARVEPVVDGCYDGWESGRH